MSKYWEFDKLRSPLRRLDRLVKLLGNYPAQWFIRQLHAVGALIIELVGPFTDNETHRDLAKTFQRLANKLGLSKSMLQDLHRFATLFTQEDAKRLTELRLANGRKFSWSHVKPLLPIENRAMREELIERCVSNSWTIADLKKAVQDYVRGTRSQSSTPAEAQNNGDADTGMILKFPGGPAASAETAAPD
jgi:hypothetical protein